METTIIVQIVKKKCENLSDSNKYRPILIATITSKVLESVILVKCKNKYIPLITNLDLNSVLVLNFAFTLYRNILSFRKDEIQQFL